MIKKMFARSAKVVLLGGGTGSCRLAAILAEIYRFIALIVTGADDGGDSKFYRQAGHPAWGDVRRAILTLSENSFLKKLFPFRFGDNMRERKDINIGNAVLAGAYDMYRKEGLPHREAVLESVAQISELAGLLPGRQALLASTGFTHLKIVLEDGTSIVGEGDIDARVWDGKRICRASLVPPVKIDENARKAIVDADIIVIGPGSWFGSVIATLLVTGVAEAIKEAISRPVNPAKIVCVVNLFTTVEDYGFKLSDFLRFIHGYLDGEMIDACIFNSRIPSTEVEGSYKQKGSFLVRFDEQSLDYCKKVIKFPCLEVDNKGHARHSSELANIFTNLDSLLDTDNDVVIVAENGKMTEDHRREYV